MRELHLVHSIKLRMGPVSVFKDSSASWTRNERGDYLLDAKEDAENTYIVPACCVKFERVVRSGEKKK